MTKLNTVIKNYKGIIDSNFYHDDLELGYFQILDEGRKQKSLSKRKNRRLKNQSASTVQTQIKQIKGNLVNNHHTNSPRVNPLVQSLEQEKTGCEQIKIMKEFV